MADMKRRVTEVKGAIRRYLVDRDVFGLAQPKTPGSLRLYNFPGAYAFETDAKKVGIFRDWLKEQTDKGILGVGKGAKAATPWTGKYIHSSYRRGLVRAYTDTHRADLVSKPEFFGGGQAQFLQQAFAAPETVSKLELLMTRNFNDLQGFTDAMAQGTSRILAEGVANGLAPSTIARRMFREVDGLTKKRALTIARTEVIHAHAEGQLDGFERLGVKEVGVMAEWLTAGDDRVCEQCASLEGRIFTIEEARNLIPEHPNCRCAWIPTDVTKAKAPKEKP